MPTNIFRLVIIIVAALFGITVLLAWPLQAGLLFTVLIPLVTIYSYRNYSKVRQAQDTAEFRRSYYGDNIPVR